MLHHPITCAMIIFPVMSVDISHIILLKIICDSGSKVVHPSSILYIFSITPYFVYLNIQAPCQNARARNYDSPLARTTMPLFKLSMLSTNMYYDCLSVYVSKYK